MCHKTGAVPFPLWEGVGMGFAEGDGELELMIATHSF